MKGFITKENTYYKIVTFNASDSIQSFIVPSNVTYINVDCVASKGHDYGASGGAGGRVQCKLSVSPGTTLYIVVGNIPSSSSRSYNASDIRTNNNGITDETSLQSRLIVAGGGGSGGYGSVFSGAGGAGGGLIGSNGSERTSSIISATGGTQISGGTKGYYPSTGESGYLKFGEDGIFGLGGNSTVASSGNGTTYSGAGGAGWYGGGSGTSRATTRNNQDAGGGAGGSSYTDSNLCSEIIHTQGYNLNSGYVILKFEGTPEDYTEIITSTKAKIYKSQNKYFCSRY